MLINLGIKTNVDFPLTIFDIKDISFTIFNKNAILPACMWAEF